LKSISKKYGSLVLRVAGCLIIKVIAAIFLVLCFIPTAFAQYQQYQFSRMDISKGLPHNDVNCFFRDNKGFLWVGTLSGLARFDGNNFKIFRHHSKIFNSISDDDVRSISEGPDGKLWMETRAGIDIYDPETDRFNHNLKQEFEKYQIAETGVRLLKKCPSGDFMFVSVSGLYIYDPIARRTQKLFHRLNDQKSISHSPIVDLAEDKHQNLWIIHVDGTLEYLNRRSNVVTQRLQVSAKFLNFESDSYRLFLDHQGLLWVYNMSVAAGAYRYDTIQQNWTKFSKNSATGKLSSDMISGIIQDETDNIWIATDHGGINIIDKSSKKVSFLLNRPNDDKSLSQNSISSIYYDRLGVVWIGTFRKGISLYHPGIFKFGLIEHSNSVNALIDNDVNKITEDASGNIWIGTNGSGLSYYNRKKGSFTNFRHDPSNPSSLAHDAVVTVYLDRSGKLWVGTYSGGLDYFNNGKFHHFTYDPANPRSLSDNRISDLLEDSKGRLWVGTGGGGINRFDQNTGSFKRYTNRNEIISSDYIFKIIEDAQHHIWVGTSFGMNLFDEKHDKFIRIINDPKNENSLINDNINSFIEDKKGYLWICTRDGLSIYHPKTNKFQNFSKLDGLPDNNLMDIQQDNKGDFWLSSSNGLSRIAVHYGKKLILKFENFDQNDGLQGQEFNRNASVRLKSGELAFAGPDGINFFYPERIKARVNPAKLFITDFQLFGQSLSVVSGEKRDVVLSKSIVDTKQITLKHDQNVFVIEFAALNFTGPDNVTYEYMLDGFDKTWITSDHNSRKASYTNLAPGNYIFKVRALGNEMHREDQSISLDIKIKNPWYASILAYVIYLVLICIALYYFRARGIRKLKDRFSAEQQEAEAERQHKAERVEALRVRELDTLKIKFLTNVSHEFRTPLSLIMAPIEKILKSDYDAVLKEQVSFVQKNARRLLNLVNQLLDFREMEMKELKLQKSRGDIVAFVKETTFSFRDLGEKKNIQLSFHSNYKALEVSFDHDKIERILFNLLSNSFKFTPEGGKVSVWIDSMVKQQTMLEIKVMDTGIGVPADQQEKIFESFFQHELDSSMINQGSGIGLSIAKEFVMLHKGEISLESEDGNGSCFIILLPFEELNDQEKDSMATGGILLSSGKNENGYSADSQISIKKSSVLIVEDDLDLRYYLKDNLKNDFNIIEAENGKDGWQKALFYHPQVVVSDISMPVMDGIELCKKLKSDGRTSQIPVILLTALTGEKQQLIGLETGANDYMTKPFSFDVLRTKIKNTLNQQEVSRKRYSKQLEVSIPTVEMESPDQQFMQEVLREIEANMDNSNFSVDMLSRLVLVSRGTLYNRMVSLTAKTPLEFIKSYRLKRAAQLLEQNKFTVSAICYKTGFKTTKNFVKSFKEEFGVLPSQYAQMKKTH